jgi:hypothetical protein
MSELYKFEKLEKQLTEWGFPVINTQSRFQAIRVDFDAHTFKEAVRNGKIQFGTDGIYLSHEGREWKGYMYMPKYKVKLYGDMPRFHLKRCEKIEELFTMGYGKLYEWSNNELNDITDRYTREVYKNQTLKLCKHCRNLIIGVNIKNTEDFFNTLDTEQHKETDINGYVIKWTKISNQYRENKNYTCESCGIKPKNSIDKRYWHVHHKDGNKMNNKESNLECLCVLCHSHKDLHHEANFNKTRMQRELESFVKAYKEELENLNNLYI